MKDNPIRIDYMWEDDSIVLDVDDLQGMIMQLEAIVNDWGMDFVPLPKEDYNKVYTFAWSQE